MFGKYLLVNDEDYARADSFRPRYTEASSIDPLDAYAMRYKAMLLCSEIFGLSHEETDESAAICGCSLYLGDFNGYTLADNCGNVYNLKALEISNGGRIAFEIWDIEADKSALYWVD